MEMGAEERSNDTPARAAVPGLKDGAARSTVCYQS